MNRNHIGDHHVVARYLADQLSDTERKDFERYYLEHPEMVRDLEEAAQLKAGLMRLRDSGELDRLLQPRRWQQRQFRSISRALRRNAGMGAVAALAIVAVATAFWLRADNSSEPWMGPTASSLIARQGLPPRIAATYTILRTRALDADVEIELPATRQILELKVLPEVVAAGATYQASLATIDANDELREVATLSGLAAGEDEFVPLYLDSSKLRAGRYQLALSNPAGVGDAATSRFTLRVLDPS